MRINIYLAVGIGGVAGAALRYGISISFFPGYGFPASTLLVNLAGCFLLGFLVNHHVLKDKLSEEVITALGVGVIGSFTTFSTFALETVFLWQGQPGLAVGYVLASVIGGLLCSAAGMRLASGRRAAE